MLNEQTSQTDFGLLQLLQEKFAEEINVWNSANYNKALPLDWDCLLVQTFNLTKKAPLNTFTDISPYTYTSKMCSFSDDMR